MKKLKLQNFSVIEIDAKEMKETDGGILGLIAAGVCAYLFWETATNPKSSMSAYQKGYNQWK